MLFTEAEKYDVAINHLLKKSSTKIDLFSISWHTIYEKNADSAKKSRRLGDAVCEKTISESTDSKKR